LRLGAFPADTGANLQATAQAHVGHGVCRGHRLLQIASVGDECREVVVRRRIAYEVVRALAKQLGDRGTVWVRNNAAFIRGVESRDRVSLAAIE
jgi:hypothetical protein